MEIAGLAVSIVSLATTFDSVINCFEYIHLGKKFGADFQGCVLKLDNARLRLSRWGEAVGLNSVDHDTASLKDTKLSEEDKPKVEERLGFILNEIEAVKQLSGKFDQSLVLSPDTSLDSTTMPLHQKMRQLAKKRQNHLSSPNKIKWAIYDRNHFFGMIEKIGIHTDALVELFPAQKEREKTLCGKETLELMEGVQVLKDLIKNQDKPLASALEALLKPLVRPLVLQTKHYPS